MTSNIHTNINIRPATIGDLAFIAHCIASLLNEITGTRKFDPVDFKEATNIAINKDSYYIFIASINQESSGIISLHESFSIYNKGTFGILNECYVIPKYRSIGIGNALIETVKTLAKEKNWVKIEVTSPPPNFLNSSGFYLRNKFEMTGEKFKYILNK